MTDFPLLFQPLDLGPVTLRNRLTMTTHTREIGARRYERYLRARAQGGAGSISVFASNGLINCATTPGRFLAEYGAESDALLPLSDVAARDYLDEREIPRLRGIAEEVQPHGAAVFGQLHHAGADRVTASGSDPGQPTVAPSPHPDEFARDIPHELSVAEIDELIRGFGDAGHRCRKAGLDGVEINACHFYLVNQFLSPYINRRTDGYGGSPTKRFRFLDEILTEVRTRTGDDMVIGLRINGSEFVPGGLTADDMADIAKLVEGRVQYLSVTAGTFSGRKGANPVAYVNPWNDDGGHMPLIHEAATIKAAVRTPVILGGRITNPAQAEDYLARGYADAVGMSRAWLADPEFAEKARTGRAHLIRRCIGTNECHAQGRPLACTVNAAAGREEEFDAAPTNSGLRVAVVGGGVAGMEAATAAATRGHDVVLFERGSTLGGLLQDVAANRGHERLADHLQYMRERLYDAGVDVRLNQPVDVDTVALGSYDRVVVATGSRPFRPDVPGINGATVVDARAVLAGAATLGQTVAVVSGLEDHLAPFHVAEVAASAGARVRIFSAQPLLGQGLEAAVWVSAMRRLVGLEVEIETLQELVGVDATGITTEHTLSRRRQEFSCDSIIIAAGGRADDALSRRLTEGEIRHDVVGDCRSPRRMIFAIQEGARVAALM
jgi:2,4-dienoyl-CoA reductase-like NADH-dependent reductase (Old Yellow Enzyme family)/NADH dehydrogenase FAD-containing subunit